VSKPGNMTEWFTTVYIKDQSKAFARNNHHHPKKPVVIM
jgi:hypothetical protein